MQFDDDDDDDDDDDHLSRIFPTGGSLIFLFITKSYTKYTHKKHTQNRKKSNYFIADMAANTSKSINC